MKEESACVDEVIDSWVKYRNLVKERREKHIEQFEDALGLERQGYGYFYERVIREAQQVREERDRLRSELLAARFSPAGTRKPDEDSGNPEGG